MKDVNTAAQHHFRTGCLIPSYFNCPNFPLLRRPEFQLSFPEAPRINKEFDAYLLAQEIIHADNAVYSTTLTLLRESGSDPVLLSLSLNSFGLNFAGRSHLVATKERIG
jgi:hypothetical protein